MRLLNHLTIFRKVLLAPVVVIVLLAAVGYQSYTAMGEIRSTLQSLERGETLLDGSREIQADLLRELAYIRDFILFGDESDVHSMEAAQANLSATLDRMIQTTTMDQIREQFRGIKAQQAEYDAILEQVEDLVRAGNKQQAMAVLQNEAEPKMNAILDRMDETITEVTSIAGGFREEAQSTASNMQVVLLSTVCVAVVVGLILALVVARAIVKPVHALADAAAKMAAGDLSISRLPAPGRDEISRTTEAFNTMLANLREVVSGITAASQTVTSASEQLSTAADQAAHAAADTARAIGQVAVGSAEQASGTAEANSRVEQLRDAIQQIAESAGSTAVEVQEAAARQHDMARELDDMTGIAEATARVSLQTEQRAQAAVAVVERALKEIEQVGTVVGHSADRIQELDRLSEQVGSITDMISNIADQTNLLALNAAIEAARAGGHGRGFAVVAEEVRKLAEQSAASAREIADLIRNIQTGTAEAVRAMSQGTERLAATNQLASEAGAALEEILGAVKQSVAEVERIAQKAERVKDQAVAAVRTFNNVAAMTEENTAASEEMAAGVAEVTNAVNRIARLSEENAAASEEVSASVEELTASAEQVASSAEGLKRTAAELQAQVGRFRLSGAAAAG
ncbi:methyl-accepting chemotaxis protein, partial [Symbiobacterium thermophilum]